MSENIKFNRIAELILKEIYGRKSSIWAVYMLTNHTKKEIYFGVSKDVPDRIGQHAQKETKAIDHWSFPRDNIETRIIQTGLTQAEASKIAHGYESQYEAGFKGYKVIQTAGI